MNPDPDRTPEQWAEDTVSEYAGGLVEIDLGDSPFVYLDAPHLRALRDRLSELLGDDEEIDLDAPVVPTGLVPPGEDVRTTAVVPASATVRYLPADSEGGEE